MQLADAARQWVMSWVGLNERVALQVRMNLLAMTLRNNDIKESLAARYPNLETFLRLNDSAFDRGMTWLQSRSLQLSEPFGWARAFLSSPEMRDVNLAEFQSSAIGLMNQREADGQMLYATDAVHNGQPTGYKAGPTFEYLQNN